MRSHPKVDVGTTYFAARDYLSEVTEMMILRRGPVMYEYRTKQLQTKICKTDAKWMPDA